MNIPHGKGAVHLGPGASGSRLLTPNFPAQDTPPEELLFKSLSQPVESPLLSSMAGPGKKILVLLPDLSREAGIPSILPALCRYLADSGAHPRHITFLIALGIHRKMSREEIFRTYGPEIQNYRCLNHEASAPGSLATLGTTSFGTPVSLNRLAVEADLVIPVGKTAFHYNAGAGGGRKMLLPGIASREACMANHKLVLTGKPYPEEWRDPRCAPGCLDSNPVHEDMKEFVEKLPAPVYNISILTNLRHKIADIASGDIFASHHRSVETLKQ